MGRKQKLKPIKPGIYILGEGMTERYYFTHLKHIYNFSCTVRPRFFCNTCITDIEHRIKELLRGDIVIICVFDADVSKRDDKENLRLQRLQQRYSKNKNVIFCDSLPSIEYWFLLHFKDTCPYFVTSKEAEKALNKYIKDYEKTELFLKNDNWVLEMSINGNLQNAIKRAEKYRTSKASYSNTFKALNKLFETVA